MIRRKSAKQLRQPPDRLRATKYFLRHNKHLRDKWFLFLRTSLSQIVISSLVYNIQFPIAILAVGLSQINQWITLS